MSWNHIDELIITYLFIDEVNPYMTATINMYLDPFSSMIEQKGAKNPFLDLCLIFRR